MRELLQPYQILSKLWLILAASSFFYIDKTTLSYAAIFDIEKDLNLHGAQYNWLRYFTLSADLVLAYAD